MSPPSSSLLTVDRLRRYVYEEEWEGGLLTEAINGTHANPKYLPGVFLGENLTAEGDLVQAVRDANSESHSPPHPPHPL